MSVVVGNMAERTLAYQCISDKLPPFRQNYQFAEKRKYELDLAFVDQKVGVEINGGIWRGYGQSDPGSKGHAHSSPQNILRDMEKSNLLVLMGWRVLRYTPEQVNDGNAIVGLKMLLTGIEAGL